MYITEPQNEHLEDKNTPSSTTPQILKDSSIHEHEETKESVLSQTEETKPQKEKKYSCPPQGNLNKVITNDKLMDSLVNRAFPENLVAKKKISRVALFMLWCVAWSFSGPEVLPGGNLFGLLIIFYSAMIGGKILELIRIPSVPQLPPLLGMLLAGFEAFEESLFKIGSRSMPHRGMFNCCYFPLPYEFSLAMGISFGKKGYGIKKGIPTLLIAASSLDDIIAITGFSACLSIAFSSGSVLKNILASFRDILIGVLAGAILGIFVRYFPSEDQIHHIGLHAAGGLFTLALSFVAGVNWSTEKIRVQRVIKTVWCIFQPLLFGLVGSEVSVTSLKSNAIGIFLRRKYLLLYRGSPKLQSSAVLGPLALETASISAPHLEPYSRDVMTIAFLAILITAPNGALIIGILGPKVLARHDPSKINVKLTKLDLH
ncbi:sodium/hydrogen exchanger 9B1 isoform X1 [Prionailurus iriomotensis]